MHAQHPCPHAPQCPGLKQCSLPRQLSAASPSAGERAARQAVGMEGSRVLFFGMHAGRRAGRQHVLPACSFAGDPRHPPRLSRDQLLQSGLPPGATARRARTGPVRLLRHRTIVAAHAAAQPALLKSPRQPGSDPPLCRMQRTATSPGRFEPGDSVRSSCMRATLKCRCLAAGAGKCAECFPTKSGRLGPS